MHKVGRVVAAFVLLGSTASALTSQAGPPVEWRDVVFRTRAGDSVPAQAGQMTVPARYEDPDGPRLTLRFLRFPTRSESPEPPIVYLAGGPGGSGIAAAAGSRWPLFDSLRDVADVIALDQRGTGPLAGLPRCTTGAVMPRDLPSTRENLSEALERQVRHCREFWEGEGVDLRAYHTPASADDLAALADALGVPTLNLWGVSYGTHLALATLRRHPDRVARAALVSAEGLDQTAKSPAAGDRFFARVQASIDEDPEARAAYPDVAAMMRRVLDRVATKPVTVSVELSSGPADITLGAFELRRLAADRIADPRGTRTVLEAFAVADHGDFTVLGGWAQRVTGEPIYLSPMPLAVDVASGISEARRRRIAEEAPGSILGDALSWPVLHAGASVEDLDLGEAFRAPFWSAHPVLFVSGELDGRTYLEEHEEIAAQFENPTAIRVENGGHGTVLDSDEVRRALVEFFGGGEPASAVVRMPAPRWVGTEGPGVPSPEM